MEFLKAILGDELYSQFESKINEYNGSEANKDKQVKIGNISTRRHKRQISTWFSKLFDISHLR